MTDTKQPEALRLAHIFDCPLPPEWTDMVAAATELRRQHARIAELEARVQELGAMARENRSRRIVELEAQLEAERITLKDHQTIPHLNSTMGGRYEGKELQYRGRR